MMTILAQALGMPAGNVEGQDGAVETSESQVVEDRLGRLQTLDQGGRRLGLQSESLVLDVICS